MKHCKSSHRCKKCQRLHHTLLHLDQEERNCAASNQPHSDVPAPTQIVSNAAIKLRSSSLLMTCRVLVFAADGSTVEARALLDNGSTSSFVSERLVQNLRLPCSQQNVHVSGIAGSLASGSVRAISNFQISSIHSKGRKINLTAIVMPKVTCDLPVIPVALDPTWTHLSGLPLADPAFGEPRCVDILLGAEVFVDILRHGRRIGPTGAPVAIETDFGWVLCGGNTNNASSPCLHVASLHVASLSGDDILRKFWETEEPPGSVFALSPEERLVLDHFQAHHSRTRAGRFVVPLPRKPDAKPIGESRSQAVRRFLCLERSLNHKKKLMLSCKNTWTSAMQSQSLCKILTRILPLSTTYQCKSFINVQAQPQKSELFSMLQPSRHQVCLSMTLYLLDQLSIPPSLTCSCASGCIESH